jgi:mono/diheme cytochrome c family protein
MVEAPMPERVFAAVGLFESPEALLEAAARLKGKCEGRLEAYTPYPVHGMEKALGLRRSPLAGMVLVMGILGAMAAMLFQGFTSALDYPVITSGKPPFSWQAFVPVMFEGMVFFAAFTAGLGMLVLLNRLPFFAHPLLAAPLISAITRDGLALAIEADAGLADPDAARVALAAAGALRVELVALPEAERPASAHILSRGLLAIAVACVVAGLGTYWAVKLFPVLPPMVHMFEQPRVGPQQASTFFKDGRAMRMPVAGTVAQGHLPYLATNEGEAAALVNPLPRTEVVLERGQKVYGVYCAVCHGATGNGVPTLTAAYGAKPANLVADPVASYTDGRLYHTLMVGKNAMPSYAVDIPEGDRWAVVHFLRVLQRSQNAKDEDIP